MPFNTPSRCCGNCCSTLPSAPMMVVTPVVVARRVIWRWAARAARGVAHGDGEHAVDAPADQWAQRDEFAERHQMLFAIVLLVRRAKREHAVVVAAVAALEGADHYIP